MLYTTARTGGKTCLAPEVRSKIAFYRIWCLVEIQCAALLRDSIVIVMKGGQMVATRHTGKVQKSYGGVRPIKRTVFLVGSEEHCFRPNVSMLRYP